MHGLCRTPSLHSLLEIVRTYSDKDYNLPGIR
jgi:hypothetical protein